MNTWNTCGMQGHTGGQSITHPTSAYAQGFHADGNQNLCVDGDIEQHELLQIPKSLSVCAEF